MFSTWVYVSTSLLGDNADGEIASIRSTAETRNAELGLTGVLIFSGRHFAQFLEGPDEKLATMKLSICRDRRHADVRTLTTPSIKHRRYGRWALAYAGRATAIDRVLSDAVRAQDVGELLDYMDHFVAGTE
ncbi:BLUF domain-containing protein [Bradyrhizobium arachidis]|uniref:BLUF domain-containing protein n=1 Tax=Bradyrhizobium TaxID=374 RepID=UPI00216262C7|nr:MULTISPECIES: BLUF domain-containing protein [Bradyrhizobium]MDN4987549.1 BLUF domain-containing protein [Bradyrhizobium sp. WYCCWR 13022]UVO36838.1 BLUF domain-containing protein [Bradyrhizobium arachidis]